ncbi:hypothetical protein TNCV_36311 [Trichonephila clavipes]|nr:hypothetical protein TNCV_36311 [Trichonephila clavipes]
MIPELALSCPNFLTTPTGGRLRLHKFNKHLSSLRSGSSVALSLEPATHRPRVRDYNHQAGATTARWEVCYQIEKEISSDAIQMT